MYSRINKWERAHRVATEHMTQAEVAMLYITQVQRCASMRHESGWSLAMVPLNAWCRC